MDRQGSSIERRSDAPSEPPVYDAVADQYDSHFTRPVDLWEDARLTRLLAPYVNGHDVLDLGCGTGWLLDHTTPAAYLGVDASAKMLNRLGDKHPGAFRVQARVGDPGWTLRVASAWLKTGAVTYPTIVSTWAAHDLSDPTELVAGCALLAPGGLAILHGQAPRYRHRDHYILDGADKNRGYLAWTPARLRDAAEATGSLILGYGGTGACPDRWAHLAAWRIGALVPVNLHYAFAVVLRLPPGPF